MSDERELAERFDRRRGRLRALAVRMLGSASDADDVVQEAWLRLRRSDADAIDNLDAWTTTVVSRLCLNALRSRRQRNEVALDAEVSDPVITREHPADPEARAELADAVGLALSIVLETLEPDERLAFVLHDTFGLSFPEIAPMIDRTPTAARQLASRARRRVQGRMPSGRPDTRAQREIVDAFFTASRGGDLEALVAVLHPDVVFRIDGGAPGRSVVISGATTVAGQAASFGPHSPVQQAATVNGSAGTIVVVDGVLVSVTAFTIVDGLIRSIDSLTDPERLRHLSFPGAS